MCKLFMFIWILGYNSISINAENSIFRVWNVTNYALQVENDWSLLFDNRPVIRLERKFTHHQLLRDIILIMRAEQCYWMCQCQTRLAGRVITHDIPPAYVQYIGLYITNIITINIMIIIIIYNILVYTFN